MIRWQKGGLLNDGIFVDEGLRTIPLVRKHEHLISQPIRLPGKPMLIRISRAQVEQFYGKTLFISYTY